MTAGNDDSTGNGRVTLAILGTKLDRLIEDVNDIKREQAGMIKVVERHTTQIDDHEGEIGRLRAQSTTWSVLNSAAVAVATWLGLRQ